MCLTCWKKAGPTVPEAPIVFPGVLVDDYDDGDVSHPRGGSLPREIDPVSSDDDGIPPPLEDLSSDNDEKHVDDRVEYRDGDPETRPLPEVSYEIFSRV